jgi:hypothetical protein
MKRILSLFAVPLIASLLSFSCSDMGGNEAEVTARELPADFEVAVYSKLNPDIAKSQILFALNDSFATTRWAALEPPAPTRVKKADCAEFLKADKDFLRTVYTEYLGCPRKGWDISKPCPADLIATGLTNGSYYVSDVTQCAIPGCSSGGWDQGALDIECPEENYPNLTEEEIAQCQAQTDVPLLDDFEAAVEHYLTAPNKELGVRDTVIASICAFNLVQADSVPSLEKDKAFLENFKYDSLLVEKHFLLQGRYEGRPYKECEAGKTGILRSEVVPDTLKDAGIFYDYGAYTYCLDPVTHQVYTLK